MTDRTDAATVDEALRLGAGVEADERQRVVDRWSKLDSRLRSFRSGRIELHLTIKERGTPSQRAILEARVAGQPDLVATSHEPEFEKALNELRDDLIRQLTDAKNRHEPRNNRQLRDKR